MKRLIRRLKIDNTIIIATIIMLIISIIGMNFISILGYLCILINMAKYKNILSIRTKQNYLLFGVYILNIIVNITNVYNLIPWLVASLLELNFIRKVNKNIENQNTL
ncbi:hypothetical protein M0Q50_09520 [bacterium]|jgi:hypothetical protein|nr:hypothetical protein [bacterium]